MNSTAFADDSFALRSNAPRTFLAVVAVALMCLPFIVAAALAGSDGMAGAMTLIAAPFFVWGVVLACILERARRAKIRFTPGAVTFPVVRRGRMKLRWITIPFGAVTGIGHLPARPGRGFSQLFSEIWVVYTREGHWTIDRELLGGNARIAAEETAARSGCEIEEINLETTRASAELARSNAAVGTGIVWLGVLAAIAGLITLVNSPGDAGSVLVPAVLAMGFGVAIRRAAAGMNERR